MCKKKGFAAIGRCEKPSLPGQTFVALIPSLRSVAVFALWCHACRELREFLLSFKPHTHPGRDSAMRRDFLVFKVDKFALWKILLKSL